MKLYSAIDLHSNNQYVVVSDENDKRIIDRRIPNRLEDTLTLLEPYRDAIVGIAVESTYNWYWLVDGLIDHGYSLHLVNTAAVKQYSGLKYSDDKHDAAWLAHLMRLGILPTGYIYPKEQRYIRDLLRKRMMLVHQRTQCLLTVKGYYARHTGADIASSAIYREPEACVFGNPWQRLCLLASIHCFEALTEDIGQIESMVLQHLKTADDFTNLKTTPGIGDVLAMTIYLETGDINRFQHVGNYASYCRVVPSEYTSNGKRKGKGNVKNGNRYLSWAFAEAAHHAVVHNKTIQKYYDKKKRKSNGMVAIRAIAHKLARACYHILCNHEKFNMQLAFG